MTTSLEFAPSFAPSSEKEVKVSISLKRYQELMKLDKKVKSTRRKKFRQKQAREKEIKDFAQAVFDKDLKKLLVDKLELEHLIDALEEMELSTCLDFHKASQDKFIEYETKIEEIDEEIEDEIRNNIMEFHNYSEQDDEYYDFSWLIEFLVSEWKQKLESRKKHILDHFSEFYTIKHQDQNPEKDQLYTCCACNDTHQQKSTAIFHALMRH